MKLLIHRILSINGKYNLAIGLFVLFTFFQLNQCLSQQTAQLEIENIRVLSKKTNLTIKDSSDLSKQLDKLRFSAYSKGYLTFSIDSIIRKDTLVQIVYGELGERVKLVRLELTPETERIIRSVGLSPRTLQVNKPNPLVLSKNLEQLLTSLENNGYPFARLELVHLKQNGDELSCELKVTPNQRLKWLGVEIAGTDVKISPKFITNYLHVEEGDWYSQEVVNLIPTRLKQLTYLKETKPSELLFTPEGATLYLYLSSKPVSLFNGTIGLQQNPVTKTYQITGDLRLKLQNAFKHGELFDFNFRSIQAGSPQLNLQLTYPFLFNTPFGIDGQFQLFKRDSTFLELKSSIGVNYYLSAGNLLKAFYKNQQSSTLGSIVNPNFGSTKSNQYGLALSHQTLDYLPNPRKGKIWSIEGSAGNRTLRKDTLRQNSIIYSGKLSFANYFSLSKRFVLKTGVITESFSTTSIQQNELLRFGGNLSQRGFLEDELLGTFRATGTVEIRFILDLNSYFFAFYDQTWYERNVTNYINDTPKGFGAGLTFGTNIGIFSLTYALGQQFTNPILFRDSKIHFGYVAYF